MSVTLTTSKDDLGADDVDAAPAQTTKKSKYDIDDNEGCLKSFIYLAITFQRSRARSGH
jgi:hypothetical protein